MGMPWAVFGREMSTAVMPRPSQAFRALSTAAAQAGSRPCPRYSLGRPMRSHHPERMKLSVPGAASVIGERATRQGEVWTDVHA